MKRVSKSRKKSQSIQRESREDHYVLRVEDAIISGKIREALQKDEAQDLDLQTDFPKPGREGFLHVGEDKVPMLILDLPTVVETYKTLDDVHCVKLADVSQMLYAGSDPPKSAENEEESKHGVLPPFSDVRRRVFKPSVKYPVADVTAVEEDLLAIFDGWAPASHKYIDTEETCIQKDGKVKWVPSVDCEKMEK